MWHQGFNHNFTKLRDYFLCAKKRNPLNVNNAWSMFCARCTTEICFLHCLRFDRLLFGWTIPLNLCCLFNFCFMLATGIYSNSHSINQIFLRFVNLQRQDNGQLGACGCTSWQPVNGKNTVTFSKHTKVPDMHIYNVFKYRQRTIKVIYLNSVTKYVGSLIHYTKTSTS